MANNKKATNEKDGWLAVVAPDARANKGDWKAGLMVETSVANWRKIKDMADAMGAFTHIGLTTGYLQVFTGDGCIVDNAKIPKAGVLAAIDQIDKLKDTSEKATRDMLGEDGYVEEIGIKIGANGNGFCLVAVPNMNDDEEDIVSDWLPFSLLIPYLPTPCHR